MHRLFVAIRPPPSIRDLLIGLMGGVRGTASKASNGGARR
jgi:hypothetical protein